MCKNISSILRTILFLSMVLFMGSAEIFAKPPAPTLRVVQPYYNDNGPPKMYVRWDRVWGGLEYQYQRKVEGGTYGDWIVSDPDVSANFVIDEIEPGKRYTYRVRVRVMGQDEWSNPSAPRSNTAVRVWPVTKGDCSAEESKGISSSESRIILGVENFLIFF